MTAAQIRPKELWSSNALQRWVRGAFECHHIWASGAALVTKIAVDSEATLAEHDREDLGFLVRAIGDIARSLGRPWPVVALVTAEREEARNAVGRWAREQAWHQGEFVVEVLKASEETLLAQRVNAWTGHAHPARTSATTTPGRLDPETIALALEDSPSTRDDAKSLSSALVEALRTRLAAPLEEWAKRQIAAADAAAPPPTGAPS